MLVPFYFLTFFMCIFFFLLLLKEKNYFIERAGQGTEDTGST